MLPLSFERLHNRADQRVGFSQTSQFPPLFSRISWRALWYVYLFKVRWSRPPMRSRAGQFRGSAPSPKPLLFTSSPTTEISIEFQPPANANHLGTRSESQGATRCGSHVGRRKPISDQGCFCDCLFPVRFGSHQAN